MRPTTRILSSFLVTGLCSPNGAHGAPARERRGASGPRERPNRGPGPSPGLVRTRPPNGAHSAPARERRGAAGSPRATEPGSGAEPRLI